jgi:hypothetical protein
MADERRALPSFPTELFVEAVIARREGTHRELATNDLRDLGHRKRPEPLSLSLRSRRDSFDIAGADRSSRHLQDPRHDRRVRDDGIAVFHHDMPSAERVFPVFVGEVALESLLEEVADLRQQLTRALSCGEAADGGHADRLLEHARSARPYRPRHVRLRVDLVRILDSYASLLVLLLANFFLLEIVDDPRWGAIGSTMLAAIALVVAISDPDTGHTITREQALLIAACVALAPVVLFVNSAELLGLTYLLPAVLLVTATLPVTVNRVLHHRRITYETVLGALCAYVLIGLLFAFLYLAVHELRDEPFFAQPGPHPQSEYLYFSFVALTTLGFGDLSPSVGLPQALTVLEALAGQIFLVTMVARLVTLWVRQSDSRGG